MTVRAHESAYTALEKAQSKLRGAIESQLLELGAARSRVHDVARRVSNEATQHDLSLGESLVLAAATFDASDYEDDVVVCDSAKQLLVATTRALEHLASSGCANATAGILSHVADVCRQAEADLTSVVDLVQLEEADAPEFGSHVPYAAEELEHRWHAVLELLEDAKPEQHASEDLVASIRDLAQVLDGREPVQNARGESKEIADD